MELTNGRKTKAYAHLLIGRVNHFDVSGALGGLSSFICVLRFRVFFFALLSGVFSRDVLSSLLTDLPGLIFFCFVFFPRLRGML